MHCAMASLGIEGRSTGTSKVMGMATVTIPAATGTKGGGAVMGLRPQYQGGSSFTVFSAQGSNPLVNCKLCGKGIQKVYDKSVKGYVYACTGTHYSSKVQLPKDESKTGLQLIHPYLVLQLFIPPGQHFNLELRVSDTTNTRRKMYFSTSFSELKTTPLHCQIPLSMVIRNIWLSLALHVPDLFYHCFRVISFRSVEVIILGPVCKLRKIFTLRNRLSEPGSGNSFEEPLPQEHMFASGVENVTQVIDMAKLQSALGIEVPNIEGCPRGPESVLSARKLTLNKLEYPRQVHVAFGSRMPLVSSTAQLNAPTNDEKVERVTKAKPLQDIPNDPVSKPPEKFDRRSPLVGRSATPDVVNNNNEGPKQDRKPESEVDNKQTVTKGPKPVKKKEERQQQMKPRKDAEIAKPKEMKQQQVRYEDSPPITPCGWERCVSSDDMNFKVHTLFEKLGDYNRDNEEPGLFPSLSEDGELSVLQEEPCAESPPHDHTEMQVKGTQNNIQEATKKAKEINNVGGLKFYQFELEKDFMLREGNSASGSDDDISWCSATSGRASPNVLNDLEDLVKKTRLTSDEEETKKLATKDEVGTEDTAPFDSAEDLFVVHEQDGSLSDDEECSEEHKEMFEAHMVAKPILKLDSARKISPGPSSSRRKSIHTQLEELCGRSSEELDGASEDDLDLLYDPTLDCYYDPKTNRYYELK